MDWMEILKQIFEVCIIPLLGIATVYLITLIKKKANEIAEKTKNEKAAKYITMVADTIATCVVATNQTYVNSLKEKGEFGIEAQKEAFQKTLDAVLAILTEDAKEYLKVVYGDLNKYLTTQIEAMVNVNKITV